MDVYKVGINLILSNGVSSGLKLIIGQLGLANTAVNTLNSSLGRLKVAAAGAAGILGGVAIFHGFKKLVEHGKEVNNQLERMKLAGMSYAEIQEAIVSAQKTSSSVMTTTYSENLKHLLELRYAFGENSQAMHHIEEISKSNAILNAMRGGGNDQVWELVKSLEGKGLTFDPAAFSSYVNTMTKVIEATGGKVTPDMFFNTFKYGRTATQLWDEKFVGGALPRLIQEMSGGKGGGGGAGGPGNALMTGFAKLVQGQMSRASGEELSFLGLGTAKKIKGAGSMMANVPSADVFAKNPYEWVQTILGPALKKSGIDMTDTVKVAQHVQKLFGVRTIADAVMKMLLQGRFMEGANAPFEKDIRLQKGAMNLNEAFSELMNGHYETVLKAFNAQWTRLLETLGGPTMAAAIPIMRTLADGLEKLGRSAAANPEGVKTALGIIAAIGASLFVAGLIALGAAISPLLGFGGFMVSLAAGLATLAAAFPRVAEALTWLGNLPTKIIQALTDAANKAIAAIPGIFSGIGSAIIGALKGMLPHLSPGGGSGASSGTPGMPLGSPMNYKATPPGRGGNGMTTAAVYLDNRKVGHMVMAEMANRMSGPIQGSVYPDATRSSVRNDTSYVT